MSLYKKLWAERPSEEQAMFENWDKKIRQAIYESDLVVVLYEDPIKRFRYNFSDSAKKVVARFAESGITIRLEGNKITAGGWAS